MINDVKNLSMLICYSHIFFGKVSIFRPFLTGYFGFENSLYILDTCPLAGIQFITIFFWSAACLLFSNGVFQRTYVSILMKFNLSIFLLQIVLLVSYLRNPCLSQGHRDFLLYFFLKFFIILVFTFKSRIIFS